MAEVVAFRRTGRFSVLQYASPGGPPHNIGVLLHDPERDRLFFRLRERCGELAASDDDAELLEALSGDLAIKAQDMGAGAVFDWLDDSASLTLRVTGQESVDVDAFTRVLDRLFRENVTPIEVIRYRSHLPLFSLAAAASRFRGDELAVEAEPEDWVPTPEAVRAAEEYFVLHISGESMSPRIPDGSLAVFRYGVVGSRDGKILLIEQSGSALNRFSVKRYRSRKRATETGWEHDKITLESINPAFPPFTIRPEECRVIAEFVQVLD